MTSEEVMKIWRMSKHRATRHPLSNDQIGQIRSSLCILMSLSDDIKTDRAIEAIEIILRDAEDKVWDL